MTQSKTHIMTPDELMQGAARAAKAERDSYECYMRDAETWVVEKDRKVVLSDWLDPIDVGVQYIEVQALNAALRSIAENVRDCPDVKRIMADRMMQRVASDADRDLAVALPDLLITALMALAGEP